MSAINVNIVLSVLSNHIGKAKGINVGNLAYAIIGEAVTAGDERRVRHVITELRLEGYHVCAHPSTGYFIAVTDEELNETCKYLYDRAMKSLTQVSRMKNVSLPDLASQLKLLN